MLIRAANPEDHGLVTIVPNFIWRTSSNFYLVSKKYLPTLYGLPLREVFEMFPRKKPDENVSKKLTFPNLFIIEDESVFTEIPVLTMEQTHDGFRLSYESQYDLTEYIRKFPQITYTLFSSLLCSVREDKQFVISRKKMLQLLRNPHHTFSSMRICKKNRKLMVSPKIVEDEIKKICTKLGYPELESIANTIYKNHLQYKIIDIGFANYAVERLVAVCVYKSFQARGVKLSKKILCETSQITPKIFQHTLIRYSQYIPLVSKKPVLRSIVKSFINEVYMLPSIRDYALSLSEELKESEINSIPKITAGAIIGYSVIMNNYHEILPMYQIAQKLLISPSAMNKQIKHLARKNGREVQSLLSFKKRIHDQFLGRTGTQEIAKEI